MITKTISGWTLLFNTRNSEVAIKVTHKDNSIICDTGEEIGDDDELSYRLTSHGIENDHNLNGEANAEHTSDKFTLDNWEIIIINDDDNHLNIHCKNIKDDPESLKYVSSTDGTEKSKECILVFSS